MKYLKTYQEFRLNEGILGNLLDFFKGVWKKYAAEMQKLNDDPNKIKEYVTNNILNPKAPNGVITLELKKFNEKTTLASADVFDLINSVLNKDTGALGKQGIGTLFADKLLQGDNMKVKRLSFDYIVTTVRDQMIAKIKFNPKEADKKKYIDSLKVGIVLEKRSYKIFEEEANDNSKETPSSTSAPDIKENLTKITEWFNTNITNVLIAFVKAVREDDIKAAVAKGGVTNTEYKVGDMVRYKRDKYIEGTDDDKQPKDAIGSLKISKIDGDNYTFIDDNNRPFTKTKDQILGKVEGDDSHGTEDAHKLKDTLTKMKDNPEQIKTMNQLANLYIKEPEKIKQLLASETSQQ